MKERNDLVKLIHIAKNSAKECPICGAVSYRRKCDICKLETRKLSDSRYRQMLESFGGSSCRFLSQDDLEKVYRTFLRAGFKPRINPEEDHRKARIRTIGVIKARARMLFGNASDIRVIGFIEKCMGKSNLELCDDIELRKVAGWLYRYKKYEDRKKDTDNQGE